MQKQWPDLKPLAQNKPGWADRVRLVVEPDLPDQQLMSSLTAFPRDSVAVFCREGWHLPWASFRDTPPKRGDTVWPAARPWEFSLPTNLPERIAALESKGLHVFPYANQNLLDGSWIMKPVGYESPFKETESRLYTWRVWARFFPEACQDQVELTGASGVCEGYSWVMGRYLGSEPPEENWYTGSLGMRKYLRELLPDTALMGDQVNEVTCRGQHLSRAVTADLQHAHPVSTFLFGPFTRQWSASAIPEVNAADDIHGFLQGWPSSWAAPTVPQQILGPSKGVQWQGGATVLPAEAQALLRTRGELFVKEQLVSVWPEQWDPRVLHYYQGKDGAEYRLLKDGGTRLVKVVGGKEETLYWRIGGVAEILAKGYAIPNWIGYDGDRVIGLKPDAVYLTQAAGSKPPVVISSLPKDIVIARTLHGAGYWLADLKNGSQGTGRPANLEDDESAPGSAASPLAAGDGKPVKSITLHVRGSGVPVSFAGAEAVKTLSADEYEVTMKSPGSLVAYWTNTANNITLKKEAYRLTLLRSQTGLESSIGAIAVNKDFMAPPVGSAEDGEESVLAWFVRMPLEQPWLVFKFGVGSEVFTQGVRYQVRVNGRTVWERLRREAEMKWNVDSMKLVKNPVRYGAVNMKEFEDKPVLVELIASAKDASALNWIKWENPQFMEQPPTWDAELDKPVDAPKLDAMPDLDVKH
jgi:hypothetical protein